MHPYPQIIKSDPLCQKWNIIYILRNIPYMVTQMDDKTQAEYFDIEGGEIPPECIETEDDGRIYYLDYDAETREIVKIYLPSPSISATETYDDFDYEYIIDETGSAETTTALSTGNGIPHPSTIPALRMSTGRCPRIPKDMNPGTRGFRSLPDISSYNIVAIDGKKATLNKEEVVRFLRNHFILAVDGVWYQFGGQVYEVRTDDDINELLYTSLQGVPDCPFLSRSTAADILAALKYTSTLSTLEQRKDIDIPTFDEDVDYLYDDLLIPFANGLYNFARDEILPYSPYLFIKRLYPVYYDPRVREHPVESIYRNIIPDDDTRSFFFEMLGYTAFHPDMAPPAIFLIYGPGGTGKTALQMAISSMVGSTNVSVLDLAQISSEFGPIDLLDKVVNIAGETGTGQKGYNMTPTDGELLKRLSDGQAVTFNRKFKSTITIENRTKLWFISNSLPNFGDTTSGLYRRLFIIPCREPQIWDDQIHKKVVQYDALQWLANEALEGYHRFLERGMAFEPSDLMLEEVVQYKRQEGLRDYLADYFDATTYEDVRDAMDGCFISDLYEGYKMYTLDNGGRPLSKRSMSEKLRNEFGMVSEKQPITIDGRRTSLVSLHKSDKK